MLDCCITPALKTFFCSPLVIVWSSAGLPFMVTPLSVLTLLQFTAFWLFVSLCLLPHSLLAIRVSVPNSALIQSLSAAWLFVFTYTLLRSLFTVQSLRSLSALSLSVLTSAPLGSIWAVSMLSSAGSSNALTRTAFHTGTILSHTNLSHPTVVEGISFHCFLCITSDAKNYVVAPPLF